MAGRAKENFPGGGMNTYKYRSASAMACGYIFERGTHLDEMCEMNRFSGSWSSGDVETIVDFLLDLVVVDPIS